MRPSLSWIDPTQLSAALVQAGVRREPRNRPRPTHVGLDRLRSQALVVEGGAAADPVTIGADGPPSLSPLGRSSFGRSASAAASPIRRSGGSVRQRTDPPFRPPQGVLETRLKAFFSWAIDITGTRSLFLTDQEGLVLMESGASNELIAATASFAGLLDRLRETLGSEPQGVVTIDLDPRRILHVVRIDTGLGVHTLGLVSSQPLDRKLTEELRSAVSDLLAAVDVEELFGR